MHAASVSLSQTLKLAAGFPAGAPASTADWFFKWVVSLDQYCHNMHNTCWKLENMGTNDCQ